MEKIKETASEILDISQNIYQINESNNPTAIFTGKTFLIGTEDNREAVSVKRNSEKKDGSYYIETPEIIGEIIKYENGNYGVKACVKYTNDSNQDLWFAKIRIHISYDGNIQIMGAWGSSWQYPDYEDEDLINNSDLPAALNAMKEHLSDIYSRLCNNDFSDPEWVKKLKKYNN